MGVYTLFMLDREVNKLYDRLEDLENRIYELEWEVYEQRRIIHYLRSINME